MKSPLIFAKNKEINHHTTRISMMEFCAIENNCHNRMRVLVGVSNDNKTKDRL